MNTKSPVRAAFEKRFPEIQTGANLQRTKHGYCSDATRLAWRVWRAASAQTEPVKPLEWSDAVPMVEIRKLIGGARDLFSDSCNHTKDAIEFINSCMSVAAEKAESKVLPPVHGDVLPPIGSELEIHLGSLDKWVVHTVVGYYAWADRGGDKNLHRVFVRVVDSKGFPNARLLADTRPVSKDGAA